MMEHVTDAYVQKAKADGYRARAAYKLLEIDDKDRLLRPGQTVVDLGAAPGSWSQVAAKRCHGGKIVALDLLPIEPVPGVHFILGDFTEDEPLEMLTSWLNGASVDVVLSDMAPNMSGIELTDQARSIYLAELALDFALNHLRPGGTFLTKIFQGQGFMEFRDAASKHFSSFVVRKPKASRDRSPEVFLLGTGFKA